MRYLDYFLASELVWSTPNLSDGLSLLTPNPQVDGINYFSHHT